MIERNGPLLAERVALVQVRADGSARPARDRPREPLARGGDDGADHLVQRIADRLRVLGVRRIEIRQIRTAQAGQMRLEQESGPARRQDRPGQVPGYRPVRFGLELLMCPASKRSLPAKSSTESHAGFARISAPTFEKRPQHTCGRIGGQGGRKARIARLTPR